MLPYYQLCEYNVITKTTLLDYITVATRNFPVIVIIIVLHLLLMYRYARISPSCGSTWTPVATHTHRDTSSRRAPIPSKITERTGYMHTASILYMTNHGKIAKTCWENLHNLQ